MKKHAVIVPCALLFVSCSTFDSYPSVSVSIEDMEGVGNENIQECQISFEGDYTLNPCVLEVEFTWDVDSTLL